MKAAPFALEALRAAAGDTVFARGKAYFTDGRVEIVRRADDGVRARVMGGADYAVEVQRRRGALVGRCTCPAHRDYGFCKHMVAAALAANDAVARGEPASDPEADIAVYLESLDRPALKALILGFSQNDEGIARKLQLAAALGRGDAKAVGDRLRREIDAATKISGYVAYDEAGGWAARVAEVMDALEAAQAGAEGEGMLGLIDRLIERLQEASERIDDSNGELWNLLNRAADLRFEACRKAKPEPLALARDLLARELDGEPGFEGCTQLYGEVLGPRGRAEVERLARKAWEEIPPADRRRRGGHRESPDEAPFLRSRLAEILDGFAEEAGDLDARIALRSRHLQRPADYLALADFCAAQGREAEAVKWVEEALFVFEDEADPRLAGFAADLLSRHGREAEAEATLWRAFAAKPTQALFGKIVAGAKGEKRAQAVDRATALLKAAAAKPNAPYGAADLALALLVGEGRHAEAWAYAATLGGPAQRLLSLAQASETTHPPEAAQVYRRQIETELTRGGERAYAEAKALIDRLGAMAQKRGGAAEHAAYVAQVLARHRAKRNFIKLMLASGWPVG